MPGRTTVSLERKVAVAALFVAVSSAALANYVTAAECAANFINLDSDDSSYLELGEIQGSDCQFVSNNAVSLLSTYDQDGDGELNESEWGFMCDEYF